MTFGTGRLRSTRLITEFLQISFLLGKLYFANSRKDSLGWKMFEVPKSYFVFLLFSVKNAF